MKDIKAFPGEISRGRWKDEDGVTQSQFQSGMSLRDWFAGQALIGYLSNPERIGGSFKEVAESSFIMADAMLKERNEPQY